MSDLFDAVLEAHGVRVIPSGDHDQAIQVLRHAVDRSVTFIDTADSRREAARTCRSPST